MKNFVDGLNVKEGRLINDRPDGMTGIAKAAMMKKALKRQEKAQMIEEGIMRAKMMEKYMD